MSYSITSKKEGKARLIAAKALIVDPANWTQGVYKKDGCKFCSKGALREQSRNDMWYADCWLNTAAYQMGFDGPIHLNDSTDHSTVMKMFDLAISIAEKECEE